MESLLDPRRVDTQPSNSRRPSLLDAELLLARAAGATVTPEVVVFDSHGNRCYRGRIDGRFPDLGREASSVQHHELIQALEAILIRKVPKPAATQSVGCRLTFM